MSASEQTAIRSNVEYIAKMGEAIGEVYGKLWQEMAWIHTKWAQYIELFGTNPERIDLLNRAAPAMIRTVQDTLWDDVLLHLGRLNDPPKSSGRGNLGVRHLAGLLGKVLRSPPVLRTMRRLRSEIPNLQGIGATVGSRIAHWILRLGKALNPLRQPPERMSRRLCLRSTKC